MLHSDLNRAMNTNERYFEPELRLFWSETGFLISNNNSNKSSNRNNNNNKEYNNNKTADQPRRGRYILSCGYFGARPVLSSARAGNLLSCQFAFGHANNSNNNSNKNNNKHNKINNNNNSDNKSNFNHSNNKIQLF